MFPCQLGHPEDHPRLLTLPTPDLPLLLNAVHLSLSSFHRNQQELPLQLFEVQQMPTHHISSPSSTSTLVQTFVPFLTHQHHNLALDVDFHLPCSSTFLLKPGIRLWMPKTCPITSHRNVLARVCAMFLLLLCQNNVMMPMSQLKAAAATAQTLLYQLTARPQATYV